MKKLIIKILIFILFYSFAEYTRAENDPDNPFIPKLPVIQKPIELIVPPDNTPPILTHPVQPFPFTPPIISPPVSQDIPTPELIITGLIWNTNRPQAIINGKVLEIGDTLGSFKIVNITQTGVEISTPGKVLTISPYSQENSNERIY